jgi:hypothetical protein
MYLYSITIQRIINLNKNNRIFCKFKDLCAKFENRWLIGSLWDNHWYING